ncbi:metallophosphoesterase [Fenollaria sporofastidiosus]|uniref:metallophosphoesterase n=1 Tax=Fenollaria sporofastidiosus TaxID=2811778 RepID=UPI001C00494F|nr:metallophosphoesterase [Fenollaria sporofastidiosus]
MKIQKKHIKYIILVLLIVLALLAFDVRLKTVHYTITSDKINKPMRIALITDLHSCRYGAGQKTLIDAVNREKPDIVLLGGDIFDDEIPDENTKVFLTAIAKDYPCYYVTGNHEYWSMRSDEMLAWLDEHGIKDIGGKCVRVSQNSNEITLSGVNDPDQARYTGRGIGMRAELDKTRDARHADEFSILLAHRPSFVNIYLDYGFDLILTGHAHGGQWRIPGILNGTFAPDEGFFPKYAGGLYSFDHGTEMIVSRGLARESTRVPRIFNRPELVIIKISR